MHVLQLPIHCTICKAVTNIADPRSAPSPSQLPAPSSHAPPPPSPFNHAPPGDPPHAHGRKRAVICGISYRYSRHETQGSRLPTGDSLLFHYSGHGSRQRNYNGDEVDGYDETLCPLDFETQGMTVDDEINATIVRPLSHGIFLGIFRGVGCCGILGFWCVLVCGIWLGFLCVLLVSRSASFVVGAAIKLGMRQSWIVRPEIPLVTGAWPLRALLASSCDALINMKPSSVGLTGRIGSGLLPVLGPLEYWTFEIMVDPIVLKLSRLSMISFAPKLKSSSMFGVE
ncbi:Metacaspase-1 [Hibiscus syriacus]|uniref:Metacaspase-1 n=1 Tax=Hibiscus syriacus TaxID=106335 RepID=A0A6A3CJP2_HIBSY|nr:Metacaspase-1 [Hibiscus syriacus]